MDALAKMLLIFGALLLALGTALWALGRFDGAKHWLGWFGHLPGDIHLQRQDFTFFAPIASSLLISIVLSLLLSGLFFFLRK